ncbi:hypothetical protein [Spirochaeta cellobiosiphila]|uniref:hypothetical protein n=1 Tax=Spirochaeta cellobiosiphila TaxID=504483 RepID=UPI0012EC2B41|nr:hypothetical protein [Spirochaeta cellobiosiphila]
MQEARYLFKDQKNILIVRYDSQPERKLKASKLFDNVINNLLWEKIIYIDGYVKGSIYKDIKKLVIELKSKDNNIDKVFIGEVRNLYFRLLAINLKPRLIYKVDDGASSIHIQYHYLKKGYYPKINNLLKEYTKYIYIKIRYGLILPLKFKFHLFTIFDLDPHRNQKKMSNYYSYLNSLIKNNENTKRKNVIYFMGAPLSEDGRISEEYFIMKMRQVSDKFEISGNNIVYIPHRRESDSKLNILNEMGYEVERWDDIAELGFKKRGILPSKIISFYSTTLITIPLIYGCSAESVELDLTQVREQDRGDIKLIYNEYRKIIPVIKLYEVHDDKNN